MSSRQRRIVSLAGKDPSRNQTGSVVHIVAAGKEIFKSGGEFNDASYYSLTDSSFSTVTSLLSSEPVIISVYYNDLSTGHTMVAYSYSSLTEEIKMHDPWVGASTISVNKKQLITDGFKTNALSGRIYGKYYVSY